MDREALVYDHFIKPFIGKTDRKVGVELEFPIQTKDGSKPSMESLLKILPALKEFEFEPAYYSADGKIIWTKNKRDIYLSFDTSYLNFEFSLCPFSSVAEAAEAFCVYYLITDEVMGRYQYQLCGKALNDQAVRNGESFRIVRKSDEICELEYEYLKKHGSDKVFTHRQHPNFFTLISSIQTHFDSDEKQLVRLMNLLSKLDWLEVLLFANSPYQIGSKTYLDARYYLYRNSAFADLGLTGCNDRDYESIDDIVRDYASRKVPWPFGEGQEDLLYSYRNEELTRYGTVEYRVADTQPIADAMLPAAFNYGLIRRLDETEEVLERLKRNLFASYTNNELADRAALFDTDGFFEKKELIEGIWSLYEIAGQGLNPEEEKILQSLPRRIDGLLSPAKEQIQKMRQLA